MNDINQNIKDSFDAIGLILVFVFVLFGIRYPQITKDIDTKLPVAGRTEEIEDHRKLLLNSFFLNSLPLILINGAMLYLLLPLTVKVIQTSRLDLWGFDFLRTSFLSVFLFICFFFFWSLVLGINLCKRILKTYKIK